MMKTIRSKSAGGTFRDAVLILALAIGALTDDAAALEIPFIWPLCGRIGEAPGNWTHAAPCPAAAGDGSRHDLPIHNAFGYRTYVSLARPISFHRGLDFATRAATADNGFVGNPVFAACSGYVYRILGADPDTALELKCPEDPAALGQHGTAACAFSTCITVVYRHVRALRVAVDAIAPLGTHLGYSGETAPQGDVFEHLHFEVLDPRARPTNANGGVTAFSKDAVSPVNYLPRPVGHGSAPGLVPIDVTLPVQNPFAQYVGADVGLTIELRASPGFLHNFNAVGVEVFTRDDQNSIWTRIAKDDAAIAADTGGLVLPGEYSGDLETNYEVAGADSYIARFEPQALGNLYSPYSANSSLWQFERNMTYYRTLAGSQHPGLDGLMERNADGKLPNGHRVLDFDMKLIAPMANPDEAIESDIDPASWWGFHWGLREFGASIPEPYCVRVELSVLPTVPGGSGARKRVVLAQPEDTACPAADDLERIHRDGFEG